MIDFFGNETEHALYGRKNEVLIASENQKGTEDSEHSSTREIRR